MATQNIFGLIARPFEIAFVNSAFPLVDSIENDRLALIDTFSILMDENVVDLNHPFVQYLFEYQIFAKIFIKINLNYIHGPFYASKLIGSFNSIEVT